MKLEILQKCYKVGYVPQWGPFIHSETVYADTAGKAKMKFDNFNDLPFTEIKAIREKSEDWVLFEGERVRRDFLEDRIRLQQWRKEMEAFVAHNQGRAVYIFSAEWEAYWREGAKGYTQTRKDAGKYEINDAWSQVSHCGIEKRIVFFLV